MRKSQTIKQIEKVRTQFRLPKLLRQEFGSVCYKKQIKESEVVANLIRAWLAYHG